MTNEFYSKEQVYLAWNQVHCMHLTPQFSDFAKLLHPVRLPKPQLTPDEVKAIAKAYLQGLNQENPYEFNTMQYWAFKAGQEQND